MATTLDKFRAERAADGAVVQRREPRAAEKTSPRARARGAMSKASLMGVIVFGGASIALYATFFAMIGPLSLVYTARTAAGAFAVVASALAFSLVYGTFAKYFLDLLGFRELH